MKPAATLAILALIAVSCVEPAYASCNGNLVCEPPGETGASCPSDCCMRVKNGLCEFYSLCAQWDPDCCSSGCASSEHSCSAGNTKQACPLGYCSGGACIDSCTSYLECASGYCSGSPAKTCVQRAADYGVPADGAQSCRECHLGGVCAPCVSCLSINSQGYAVYKGDAVVISYEISNGCGSAIIVSLSVSGPLRKYATLSAQTLSIGSETKRFYITVSDIPPASYSYGAVPAGEYELKLSASSSVGQAAYVSYVFLLPSLVFSSGMDVPANRIVGHSVRETLMAQGSQLLPVELEVWAW